MVKSRLRPSVIVSVNPKSFHFYVRFLLAALFSQLGAFAIDLGPIYDSFPLTLQQGKRTEWLGPLVNVEKTTNDWGWTFSPLMSYRYNPGVDNTSFDLLYPIITHDRYGSEYRFQIFQVFSISGGNNQNQEKETVHAFPILFPTTRARSKRQLYSPASHLWNAKESTLPRPHSFHSDADLCPNG